MMAEMSAGEITRRLEELTQRIEKLEYVRKDVYEADKNLIAWQNALLTHWQEAHDEKHTWMYRAVASSVLLTIVNVVLALAKA